MEMNLLFSLILIAIKDKHHNTNIYETRLY